MFIIGIDPGFASVGYSVLCSSENFLDIQRVGVFRTEKSSKKRAIYAADDNFRRAKEIGKLLEDLCREFSPIGYIAVESMSFPRNASAAAKVAMFWGLLASVCMRYQSSVVQLMPMEIKKAVVGSKTATKEDVREAVRKKFEHNLALLDAFESGHPKDCREHVYDSLGAVITSINSEVALLLKRSSE
jgi:Holliday junction resolvasome RuvABC endonuclease subunit